MAAGKAKLGEIVVDGKQIEILWIPPSRRRACTVVMLHGGLGCIALWKDFPQQLAQATGCGVLAYSRYGNGGSEPLHEKRPVRYMHHEGEVVLPELMAKLGIVKPVLVGHSDGGSIAIIYAGKFPGHARGLVLEAPHIMVEDFGLRNTVRARKVYDTLDLRRRLGRYHRDVDATFWGWNDVWLDPRFRTWNLELYLPRIRCPVLMIQGEQDEYGTIAQLEIIRAAVPDGRILMLPNCSHEPHRDHPKIVLAQIARFIAALERTPVGKGKFFQD